MTGQMDRPGGGAIRRPQIEMRSIDFVPEDERHGKLRDQGPFWFLSNFNFMTIALGFVGPSMGLSLMGTIVASIIGILVGTTFLAFHATQGPALGLPQMIQSRAQFGFRGVIFPLIAGMFSPLSFAIVATVLIAEGAGKLFGIDRFTAIAAVAIISGALAIFGHDGMHRAFKLLFWLSLPTYLLLSFALTGHHIAGGEEATGGWVWAAFFTQLSTTAGLYLGLTLYASDYSRYLPRSTKPALIIGHVFLGSALSAIWLISLGAWLATSFGASDSLLALYEAGNSVLNGVGLAAVLLSISALIAAVGMNSYSGMLMVITSADCLRRITPTRRLRVTVLVIWTVIWAALAATLDGNAIGYVSAAMVILLYALVPWIAVNLADFFIVRKGEYRIPDLFTPQGIYGAWNARGLTAYALGVVASIPFFVVPGIYTGPAAQALGGVDIAWLIGLVVTGAAYVLPGPAASKPRQSPPKPQPADPRSREETQHADDRRKPLSMAAQRRP